jgi:predicted CopG family antitoxin
VTNNRSQILLTPEQYRDLAEIAEREKRSVQDVIREIIQDGIDQREQQYELDIEARIQTLEAARQVRNLELSDRGGKPLRHNTPAQIEELRKSRDSQIIDRGVCI